MFITEMTEAAQKEVLVIFPGRFQLFHRGHKAIYDHLVSQYGADHVYIATSNKVDLPKSPFNFNEKLQMITATGISPEHVVQTRIPYQAQEIVSNYDADNTILLFAVSDKDMANDPRFKFKNKRDGSPSYFQPKPASLNDAEPLSKHGYILTVPTVSFTILGQPVSSATEIRNLFKESDDSARQKIIQALYGKMVPEIYTMFLSELTEAEDKEFPADHGHGTTATDPKVAFLNRKAQIAHPYASSPSEALALYILNNEKSEFEKLKQTDAGEDELIAKLEKADEKENNTLDKLQTVDRELRGQLADIRAEMATLQQHISEAASVGVVASNKKMANDPRYLMSMTNDVKIDTASKNQKALKLK